MPVSIKVKRSGRIRRPALRDPQLKYIGEEMVIEQKKRWLRSINAQGNQAKKLSVKFAIIKQKFIHKRAVRDMQYTGGVMKNFTLRKAAEGTIRAECTIKQMRDRAQRCQGFDQMIGFATSDQVNLFKESQKQYGIWLLQAWVPLSG